MIPVTWSASRASSTRYADDNAPEARDHQCFAAGGAGRTNWGRRGARNSVGRSRRISGGGSLSQYVQGREFSIVRLEVCVNGRFSRCARLIARTTLRTVVRRRRRRGRRTRRRVWNIRPSLSNRVEGASVLLNVGCANCFGLMSAFSERERAIVHHSGEITRWKRRIASRRPLVSRPAGIDAAFHSPLAVLTRL